MRAGISIRRRLPNSETAALTNTRQNPPQAGLTPHQCCVRSQ